MKETLYMIIIIEAYSKSIWNMVKTAKSQRNIILTKNFSRISKNVLFRFSDFFKILFVTFIIRTINKR